MTIESPFGSEGVPAILPRGPHGLDREVVLASQRGRLLAAFVEEAAEKGYYAVTIADIVRRAGTAKRTFYEHFADKEECFVRAFEAGSSMLVGETVRAGDAVEDPILRIEAGIRAYVDGLNALPAWARLFLTDAIAAGPAVADLWIGWIELLADGLIGWRSESRVSYPQLPELTKMQAVAVLSAINELIRFEIHRNGVEGVVAMADELTRLATALLTVDVTAP
ncbi:MAG: helix-turn-helix domain-containing protein [Solirubrobacterales bacterium]